MTSAPVPILGFDADGRPNIKLWNGQTLTDDQPDAAAATPTASDQAEPQKLPFNPVNFVFYLDEAENTEGDQEIDAVYLECNDHRCHWKYYIEDLTDLWSVCEAAYKHQCEARHG